MKIPAKDKVVLQTISLPLIHVVTSISTCDIGLGGKGMLQMEMLLNRQAQVKEQLTGKRLYITAITATKISLEKYALSVPCALTSTYALSASLLVQKSSLIKTVTLTGLWLDNLSFPLIFPDWNADEEMLLLEGIEMYGMGNWVEIGDHVGTKSKESCIKHYKSAYLNSPYFPLPDMTHVVGKNKKELLAMAKAHGDDKKGELKLKDEVPFFPLRVKIEDSHKLGASGRLLSGPTAGPPAVKKATAKPQIKDTLSSPKLEDQASGRNFGSNKPKSSRDEGPSFLELSGYNPKRQEFDPEYDNDAENLLADMEFKDTDTEEERELKLRVLRVYAKRLDERKHRKDFILERNLLHPNPFEKDLSQEEKNICRRYDVFMRFHTKEEHEELLKSVVAEHRILKRLQDLAEAQTAGCHSSVAAEAYLEQKRKEAEESGLRKQNTYSGLHGQGGLDVPVSLNSVGTYSNAITAELTNSRSFTDINILASPRADLLSESEKRLCREIRLPAPQYLKMQEVMSINIFSGNITKKSDAYPFFNIEPLKVDRVYDMLVRKGIAIL